LEAPRGLRFFGANPRAVVVPPAGAEIVDAARRVLAAAVDLCAAATKLGDPFAGALRIGVIPTIAPYLLPEVGPALQRRFPQLRLLFREDKTRVLVAELEKGELDAAL